MSPALTDTPAPPTDGCQVAFSCNSLFVTFAAAVQEHQDGFRLMSPGTAASAVDTERVRRLMLHINTYAKTHSVGSDSSALMLQIHSAIRLSDY